MSELLPCPFCGSEAESDLPSTAAMVSCTNKECGVFMVFLDSPFLNDVEEQWNTRVLHSHYKRGEKAEELKKELK